MSPEALEIVGRFRSKRNVVEECILPDIGRVVRKDFGGNRAGYEAELAMLRRLAGAGVRAAEVIRAEEPVILLRRLPGAPLIDLLEGAEGDPAREMRFRQALPALREWLAGYYAASGGMILGDAHLRNFLLSPQGELAGVDFEACRPGCPEEDVARLAVFTLTYDPALTEVKRRLAGELLRECCRGLGLEPPRLAMALAGELDGLCERRQLPPEVREKYTAAVKQLMATLFI